MPSYEEPTTTYEREATELELPRRPRHRLIGVGGNPIPLVMIGALLIACGFIVGVLVEKGQGSPTSASSSSSGLASRLAALRAGGGGGTGGGFARGAVGGSGAGSFGAAGAGTTTIGQVAYVAGHTLYVTDPEGNTVKVKTSSASTVTKTVKTDVRGIHPGETVIASGKPGPNGAITAESVRVSEAGGGGLGGLFGGGGGLVAPGRGTGAGAGGTGTENGSIGSGEGPVLFGK